jgi:hypothetical protein
MHLVALVSGYRLGWHSGIPRTTAIARFRGHPRRSSQLAEDHRLAWTEPQLLAATVRVHHGDERPRSGVTWSGLALAVSNVVDGGDLYAMKAVGLLSWPPTIDHFKISRVAGNVQRNNCATVHRCEALQANADGGRLGLRPMTA